MSRLAAFLAVVLFALGLGGLLLPERVVVERSAVIDRPAATVFTLLNGFRGWDEWSPWVQRDPDLEWVRSGPEDGVGAQVDWSGDPARVGVGRQRIVASEPWGRIVLESEVAGQGGAVLTYRIDGDRLGSRVSWRFDAVAADRDGWFAGLVGRYYGWFLARWVARDFELGLAALRNAAEGLPTADFSGAGIRRVTVRAVPVARVEGIVAGADVEVETALAAAFERIARWAVDAGVPLGDAPVVLTRAGPGGVEVFTAALPLTGLAFDSPVPPVSLGHTPEGEAVCARHRGAADETLLTYERLDAWLAAHALPPGAVAWERYLANPETSNNAETGEEAGVEICRLIGNG